MRGRLVTASIAGSLLLSVVAGCGGELDDHAVTACNHVTKVDHHDFAGLADTVVAELRAIGEAKKSSVDGLRKVANTKTGLSDDPGTPFYENPGDVQYAAVSAWCHTHK